MTIELRNFSSEISAIHPHVQSVKGFTTKFFLRVFLNSVIYETFPIRNFLCIRGYTPMCTGVIWTSHDWLNKFYSLYMVAIVSIVSRHGVWIKARHRNQPNKSKIALYRLLLYCNSWLKQLYISNKMEQFSYIDGYTNY